MTEPTGDNRQSGVALGALILGSLVMVSAAAKVTPSSAEADSSRDPLAPTQVLKDSSLDALKLPFPPECIAPKLGLESVQCSTQQREEYRSEYIELKDKLSSIRSSIDPVYSRMTFEDYKNLEFYIEYPHISAIGSDGREVMLKDINLEVLRKMKDLWLQSAVIHKTLKLMENNLDLAGKELSNADPSGPAFERHFSAAKTSYSQSEIESSAKDFQIKFATFMSEHPREALKLSSRREALARR